VKQRLVRGRKLLQDEVQTFVEGALRRTAPGHAFSGMVLAMLPLAAGPAAATAGFGAGAKGTAAVKSGFLTALLLPLTPLLGIAAGVGAQCLLVSSSTADRKDRFRQIAFIIAFWVVYLGLAMGSELIMHALGRHFGWTDRTWFVTEISYWWFFILAAITFLNVAVQRATAKRQALVAAGVIPPPIMTPMKPGALARAVAGSYLMFSWIIWLTWTVHDPLATGIAAGTMLALALWPSPSCAASLLPPLDRLSAGT